jgi:hypothetical protein
MDGRVLGNIVTLCVFGALGVLVATRLKVPRAARTWVLLLIAVVVGSFVGKDTALLSVFGVSVRLNWMIVATFVGVLVGLLVRTLALRGSPKPSA